MRDKYFSPSELIYLDPTKSTYAAAKLMLENRIHRLPLIHEEPDENQKKRQRVLGVLTQSKILKFIAKNVRWKRWKMKTVPTLTTTQQ